MTTKNRDMSHYFISWPICVAIVALVAGGCVSVFSADSAFVEGEESTSDGADSAGTDTVLADNGDSGGTSPDGEDDTPQQCEPTAGGVEICDGLDNDCNNAVDEGCDDDKDLYCDAAMQVSSPPPGICTNGGDDCDDQSAEISPGGAPRCVAVDLDCDGLIDAPNLGDIDVIRDPESTTISSDITYNGNNLASVWVESTRDTLRVRFSTIAASGASKGQFIAPPADVSPISHSAFDAAIAWDDTSNTYGIAWTAISPESSTPSVFFVQVDVSGELLSDPIRLDNANGQESIRVISARDPVPNAAGYFVVLYNKTVSGQNDIYGASIPIAETQPPTFSPPQRVTSGNRLADASIAWHPGLDNSINDSAIYLLWNIYSAGTERILVKSIKASNATTDVSDSEFDYPTLASGNQSRAMLHHINDTLYITWGIVDTSVVPQVERLAISEMQLWGGFTGTKHNLVSGNLSIYDTRALVIDSSDKAVLLYKANNTNGNMVYRRQAFNPVDWRTSGTGADTDIDSLSYEKSFNLPFFSTPSQGFFAFDRYAPNGFFEVFNFYEFGTTATVTVPASKAARNTPVTNFFFREYDADRDVIEVIQLNALDNKKIERILIESDGALSPPAYMATLPDSCTEWSTAYVNGHLLCAEYASDSDLCTATVTAHVFDEAAQQWDVRDLTFPGLNDPTNGCNLRSSAFVYPRVDGYISILSTVTDWSDSNNPQQVADLITFDDTNTLASDQTLARYGSFFSSARDFKVQRVEKSTAISFAIVDRFGFRSGNILSILDASQTPVFSQYFGSSSQVGLQPFRLDSLMYDAGRWWLGGSLSDSDTQTAHAVIASVDETSGQLSAPIALSERYAGTGSVQLALANPQTFVAVYRTQTAASPPFVYDWSLVTLDLQSRDISTPVAVYSTAEERHTLSVAAANGYIAVAIPDPTNPTIRSFNIEGQPIGEGDLGRALPAASTSLFVHSGDTLRWLLNADASQDGRLFHITATCDETP
jgi:hypothetical protein